MDKAMELLEKLNYTGMERAVRELVLKNRMASTEAIAVMSKIEVCELVMEKYEIVMSQSECVLLIPKDRMDEFIKMAVYIKR